MPVQRSADTPFLGDGGDRFNPADSDRQLSFAGDADVGGLVTSAVEAMTSVGDTAEDSYQRSLDALRERGDEVVPVLAATLSALDEDQYLERWSIVQLLTDLRSGGAVEVLADVLRQPIPEERAEDPAHGLSTVGEEVIIRTTAIEALSRLVADGNREARDVLLEQLGHEVLSVRRAAVQAVADSGDRKLMDRVRDRLRGSDDEWMLSLRRIDVTEVPQADGRQFLRQREPEGDSTPPAPSDK